MANVAYDKFKEGLLNGDVDLLNDNIAVLFVQEILGSDTIVTSAVSLLEAVSFESSGTSGVPLTEISATSIGYDSGGYLLTSKVVSGATDPLFTADDILLSATTFITGGMLVYTSATPITAGTPLLYIDLGAVRETANGDFNVRWLQDGICKLFTKT